MRGSNGRGAWGRKGRGRNVGREEFLKNWWLWREERGERERKRSEEAWWKDMS